jgi:NADP-reducing hydrogenase subunit HndD
MNLNDLPDEDYDKPMGESTGAAVIFGTTGGVIEAAVRTAYELHTGKTLNKGRF